jgi:hypothetical protein
MKTPTPCPDSRAFPLLAGLAVREQQIHHCAELLPPERRPLFYSLLAAQRAAALPFRDGHDVPRGVAIEKLYFQAAGMSDADFAAHFAAQE